jgi:superfamily I DNA/RNA helicase
MQERGGYTKNCAAQLILDHAPEAAPSRRIYVDESQDLSPVDIATLKRLTRDGLILAGDQNQRIYQLGLSYRDAGLELRGRGKTLRRNYRNTDSIRKLASAYRQLAGERLPERFRGEGAGDAESTAWPAAPRTGPQPRVVRAENYEAGAAQVVEWAARYLREIGYEPENVAILAPSNDDLRELLPLLEAAGLPACNVRSRGFEFEKSAGVRLSTLHSAKGVEFPVVLLFLPPLRERAEPDPDRSAALQYNTIYVAITRAMDSLHVVAAEPIAHPQVQAVFEAARRAADA